MSVFASRYARAFADVVTSDHLDASSALRQLEDFSTALHSSRELREVLENPSVTMDEKLRVIDAIAAKIGGREGMARQIRNFLAVLTQNDRLNAIDEVLRDFRAAMDSLAGVQEAEISSARELGDDERRQLEQQIAKVAGGKVRAKYTRDASLLGGASVRIGSTVYDGSIRGQLEKLKQVLTAG
jgi:F-type H+-transporting ATPase subunit delta